MTPNSVNKTLDELLAAARRDNSVSGRDYNSLTTRSTGNSPVVELVNQLIEQAVDQKASDIHIEPGQETGQIRYRVDGSLTVVGIPIPLSLYPNIISRLKIMARLNIAENRLPQDGRFSYDYAGQELDVRVSVVPLINGEKAVLRLLNRASRFMDIDSLDLSPVNKRRFIQLCCQPSGAVIMAGPVNSGKTTALYGALQYLNSSEKNIIAIEDPVEYRLKGINQLQINPKIQLDFAEALKAVLRQDYDILAIGEIRTGEVADMLVRASLAGHLVLATIHTGEAAKVIYRLLDMGIKPYLLGISLKGIVAQRLLPRLCPDCCVTYSVEADSPIAQFLGKEFKAGMKLYHRGGCAKCHNSGIRGRIAVHEILLVDDQLQGCIAARPTLKELEEGIKASGMLTMQEDGIAKAIAGWVEIEEIMQLAAGRW